MLNILTMTGNLDLESDSKITELTIPIMLERDRDHRVRYNRHDD
jgi:hypothetical protein